MEGTEDQNPDLQMAARFLDGSRSVDADSCDPEETVNSTSFRMRQIYFAQ